MTAIANETTLSLTITLNSKVVENLKEIAADRDTTLEDVVQIVLSNYTHTYAQDEEEDVELTAEEEAELMMALEESEEEERLGIEIPFELVMQEWKDKLAEYSKKEKAGS